MINTTVATMQIDPTRIYLTGLSMGGYGTWHMAVTYPQKFAAVVPICGGGGWMYGFPKRVCALKDVPVWAFHGALDPVVPLQASQDLVNALNECGGEARLTIYPEALHDSWTQTYDNPELYQWLLEHHT